MPSALCILNLLVRLVGSCVASRGGRVLAPGASRAAKKGALLGFGELCAPLSTPFCFTLLQSRGVGSAACVTVHPQQPEPGK